MVGRRPIEHQAGYGQLNARRRRLTDMWWWQREPQTDAERLKEIARLEAVRDNMLANAPRHFAFQRVIVPIMFAIYLVAVCNTLLFHRDNAGLGFFLVMSVFGIIVGRVVYKSWVNPPARTDLWDIADRLGYENDSPRDIQAKIDHLRARLGASTPEA
jgi:hypothetical protein